MVFCAGILWSKYFGMLLDIRSRSIWLIWVEFMVACVQVAWYIYKMVEV